MKRFSAITALLAAAMLLTACSGGGGDTLADGGGGIGGTGIAASGRVTGFGSVFVNGVEFETVNSVISIDDMGATELDLRIGMIVEIKGTLNDDGTGTADTIVHEAELKGPVTSEPISDTDQRLKSFQIFDFEVIAEADVTIFDSSDGTYSFDTIALDDVLEVNGFFDPVTGIVNATRIERLDNLMDIETRLRGVVASFDSVADTFDIGTVMVSVAAGADLTDLPNGLSDGLDVKVEGIVLADGSVEAREIELESSPFEGESGEVRVEGVIENFGNCGIGCLFEVLGVGIDPTTAVFEPTPAVLNILQNGVLVQVEGDLQNGLLNADTVKLREGSIELLGFIAGAPAASSFNVEFTSGAMATVTVNVDNGTQITDASGGDPITIADLVAGDMVRVKGVNGNGVVVAETIRRKPEDEVEIEGPVDAFDPNAGAGAMGTVTILGVTFEVDSNTKFELDGVLDEEIDRVAFFNSLAVGTIVEIEDELSADGVNDADGIAEEAEIDDGDDDFGAVRVEVVGLVDAFNDNGDGTGTITVTGNTFEIDATTELVIEDAMGDEATADFATFFATIQVGNTMEVKDRDPVDGVADLARLDLNP